MLVGVAQEGLVPGDPQDEAARVRIHLRVVPNELAEGVEALGVRELGDPADDRPELGLGVDRTEELDVMRLRCGHEEVTTGRPVRLRGPLERLDDLGELGRVGEVDLDPRGGDANPRARQA